MGTLTGEFDRVTSRPRQAAQKPILQCETVNTGRFGDFWSEIVTIGGNALLISLPCSRPTTVGDRGPPTSVERTATERGR